MRVIRYHHCLLRTRAAMRALLVFFLLLKTMVETDGAPQLTVSYPTIVYFCVFVMYLDHGAAPYRIGTSLVSQGEVLLMR